MKQALGKGCQFFYSDSKNLQVGQRPLVQPRGRGEVIVIEKTDGSLSQGGEVVAIEEISRICLYFEDKEWGTYLQRDGMFGGWLPGWGTCAPTNTVRDGKRQWRAYVPA